MLSRGLSFAASRLWAGQVRGARELSSDILRPLRKLSKEQVVLPRRVAQSLPRQKHKNPRKRASKVLSELRGSLREEYRAKNPVDLPDFCVGDKVRVHFQNSLTDKPDRYEGVIIAHPKKGLDENILLRGQLFGDVFEVRVPLMSPLLRGIDVLQKRAIHKGRKRGKRVRRAKLYYLRDRDPSSYL